MRRWGGEPQPSWGGDPRPGVGNHRHYPHGARSPKNTATRRQCSSDIMCCPINSWFGTLTLQAKQVRQLSDRRGRRVAGTSSSLLATLSERGASSDTLASAGCSLTAEAPAGGPGWTCFAWAVSAGAASTPWWREVLAAARAAVASATSLTTPSEIWSRTDSDSTRVMPSGSRMLLRASIRLRVRQASSKA